jgi:hypothetical protein
MSDNKKYWIGEEIYTGIPGGDIYESLSQCFKDYYLSEKKHKITIELNDVTVTIKRKF